MADGVDIEVTVDNPTYEKIQRDDAETIAAIMQRYQEAYPPSVEKQAMAPVVMGSMEHEASKGSTTSAETNTQWAHAAVLLLIQSYRDKKGDFDHPAIKKAEVCRKISKKMEEKQFKYSSDQCDKKMRSLKYRYKLILDGNRKTGRGNHKWEYFDFMHELMCGDPIVRPVRTAASLPQEDDTTEAENTPQKKATPKRQRQAKTDPPAWFVTFAEEQNRHFEEMKKLQNAALDVARERNNIIKSFTEALLDRTK